MTGEHVRTEDGFGLVELLIAMTVLAIGITAIVAGFSSGIVAVNRANQIATAGTIADRQMEQYRALAYDSIVLDSALLSAPAAPYTTDSAYPGSGNSISSASTCAATFPAPCKPVQSPVTGPDGRSYRIDTYIGWACAVGTYDSASASCTGVSSPSRPVKQVTVVVRDTTTPFKVWFRETSTFDAAT